MSDIGIHAFDGCTGLTSINIPKSVTTINDAAFYGCSGLTSINIPNSVTTINKAAFYGCSGLTSINIPNSVTTINEAAFYGCSGVKNIYTYGDEIKIAEDDSFDSDTYNQATLYVPNSLLEEYKNTSPWSNFKNISVNEETGISSISVDDINNCQIYSLDGSKRQTLDRGANIIKSADGKVMKVMK